MSWGNTGGRGECGHGPVCMRVCVHARVCIRLCNCGYRDKSLSELGSGTNQLRRTPGWGIGANQVGKWGRRRYITAEKPPCAVSTAAMGLNALLEGVSSPRSGVLLSVDKSFSLTVSPVTAQITGLNEAVGFSVRFDGFSDRFEEAAAAAGCAPCLLPPSGRSPLFAVLPLAAVERPDFLRLVVLDATCWRKHERRS